MSQPVKISRDSAGNYNADVDTFKVAPNNILGVNFQEFRNSMIQLALSKPSEYYALRGSALKTILVENNNKIYNLVYNLLTKGDVEGIAVFGTHIPDYPKTKASNEAMSVCDSFNDILQDIFDLLMPPIGDKLAATKTQALGIAEGINK